MKSCKTTTLRDRCIVSFGGEAREAKFYKIFNNELKCLPKVYYSHVSWFTGLYVIIMENLKSQKKVINKNFIKNVGTADVQNEENDDSSEYVLQDVFMKAAEIHAKFWKDKRLLKNSWLRGTYWYNGDEVLWKMSLGSSKERWNKFKIKLLRENEGCQDGKLKWSNKLIHIIDKAYENTTWEKLQKDLNNPKNPFTLVHGDFHSGNMFYFINAKANTNETNQLIFVDWSEVGVSDPILDIGEVMILDINPGVRRKHEKKLIQAYYDRLISLGISKQEYSFENCWKKYQTFTIERWLCMFSAMDGALKDELILQFIHNQIVAFIEDHDIQASYTINPLYFSVQ